MAANDTEKVLNLESDTFDDARQNFNRVLQKLLRNMEDSGSIEGSITLKIDITMNQEYVQNFDPKVDAETRCIKKPKFDHKVSSTITVKDELKGSKNPEMELVLNPETGLYVLDYIKNVSQRSVFDDDFQENMNPGGSEEKEEGQRQIEGGNRAALPGPVEEPETDDGDFIDGEFREVSGKGPDDAQNGDSGDENTGSGENPTEEDKNDTRGDNGSDGDDDDYDYEEPEE